MEDAKNYSAYELQQPEVLDDFNLGEVNWPAKEMNKVFEIEEENGCCNRFCCPGECRAWSANIRVRNNDSLLPYLHLERDFTCTLGCICRPMVLVTSHEGESIRTVGHL